MGAALRRTHPSEWVPEYVEQRASRAALYLGFLSNLYD
jgi:hypothetical protein